MVSKGHFACACLIAGVAAGLGASRGNAEGGFTEFTFPVEKAEAKPAAAHARGKKPADAGASVTVVVDGPDASVISQSTGQGHAEKWKAFATASNATDVSTHTKGLTVDVDSQSKSIGFSKGPNGIAKAQTQTRTTISKDGKPVVVVDEVAIALARTTPYGNSAAAGVDASASAGGGYSVSVSSGKAGSR
jgi:hypothetical protein